MRFECETCEGPLLISVKYNYVVDFEIRDGVLYRVGVNKDVFDVYVQCVNHPSHTIPTQLISKIKHMMNITYRKQIEPNWDTIAGNMLDEIGLPFKEGGYH